MTAITLYQLKGQWLDMANRLSDLDLDPQTVLDTIEGSEEQMALEEKVQGYELVARNIEASVPAIEREIERLQALRQAVKARSSALRQRVQVAMTELGIQKIACPLFEMRIQKNPASLDVYQPELVPAEFWYTPEPQTELDKKKLKEAIKAGREIQGARLTQGESLRIK